METYESICIVDDNADYRTLTHLSVSQACPNHPVHTFAGGTVFLDTLPQMSQFPGLILLDQHMPDIDGHQTLKFLKQHPSYKCIPVVMMSADASSKEINGCYESGVNSFLLKSMDATLQRETLSTVCRYWLDVNQTPDGPGFHVSGWLR